MAEEKIHFQWEKSNDSLTATTSSILQEKQSCHPGEASTQQAARRKRDSQRQFWMRLVYLFYNASQGFLIPFLPLYYSSLGLGGSRIGILGSITPLTTFLIAPLWGLVSDSTERPFAILYVTCFMSMLGQWTLFQLKDDSHAIMIAVAWTAIFNAPVKPLMDSLVMQQLNDPKIQFGKFRVWGLLGFGVASSLAGTCLTSEPPLLVSMVLTLWTGLSLPLQQQRRSADRVGFQLLVGIHALLHVPLFFCISFLHRYSCYMDVSINRNKHVRRHDDHPDRTINSFVKDLRRLLSDGETLWFFILVTFMGMSAGVADNFGYVRIHEIGGSGIQMGLCRLISALAGVPMFWMAGRVTDLFGMQTVLLASLTLYGIRLGIFAFMSHPYQSFVAEALRGFTFAAFWSSATLYATSLASPTLQTTMVSTQLRMA